MRITLVSSCGLVLEAEGRTLLVDALNKQFRCYYGLPPETFSQMLAGEPPYDALCGILCTHAHPDHYNALRTRQLQAASGAPVFVPQPQTPPQLALQVGPFCVEYYQFAHTPVPGWDAITHGVYFISAAGVSVYVTADARIDAVQHRAILRGVLERPDPVLSRNARAAARGSKKELCLPHPGRRKGCLRCPPQMRTQHGPLRGRTSQCFAAGGLPVTDPAITNDQPGVGLAVCFMLTYSSLSAGACFSFSTQVMPSRMSRIPAARSRLNVP